MHTITSKSALKPVVLGCIEAWNSTGDMDALVNAVHENMLLQKIKFPLLEYAAKLLHAHIADDRQIEFCDCVIDRHTMGGNVIAGYMLQLRLQAHFNESMAKATEYIIAGNQWYVCDIIGERVMGHALLTVPAQTLPLLQQFATHPDKWIVRSIGVAGHYAIKKGLAKADAAKLFALLLSLSGTTDFHTRKGIGWAAKTMAKFHPGIVAGHESKISCPEVKQWFKTKIRIGLGRSAKYAARYNR